MNERPGNSTTEPLSLINRSIARVARQTARSLTPWIQRALQRSNAGSSEALAPRAFLGVTGRRAESFVERIQRKGGGATVWNAAPVTDRVMRTDSFATGIVQRFPDISTKYERQQTESSSGSQQAAMPFQGTIQASTDASTPAQIPTFDSPSSVTMSAASEPAESAVSFQTVRERLQRAMAESREQAAKPKPETAVPTNPGAPTPSVPAGLPPLGPSRIMPSRDAGRIRRYSRIEEVTSDRTQTSPKAAAPRPPAPPVVESSTVAPDLPEAGRRTATPEIQRSTTPVQRASEVAQPVRRTADTPPALRPLPKPVPLVDVTAVEPPTTAAIQRMSTAKPALPVNVTADDTPNSTAVQRASAVTSAPQAYNEALAASVHPPATVPSTQRAIDIELPLRLPPTATNEPNAEMPAESRSVATPVETGAQSPMGQVAETRTPQAPVVQRSTEKLADPVEHRAESESDSAPTTAQAKSNQPASIQLVAVPEASVSTPTPVQRATVEQGSLAGESPSEPITGINRRMSGEPTIVQRQGSELPLRAAPQRTLPAETNTDTIGQTTSAGDADTIQASHAADALTPSAPRVVAPEPAASATQAAPEIQRQQAGTSTEPVAPRATIRPSAPAVQRALDEVMPVRAAPATTRPAEVESGPSETRIEDGSQTPIVATSAPHTTPTIQRSSRSETAIVASAAKSPDCNPAGASTIQRDEPSLPRVTSSTESAQPQSIVPTDTKTSTPIGRIVEATSSNLPDTTSIPRHIDPDMPLSLKPADEAPAQDASVSSSTPTTVQRSQETSGPSGEATSLPLATRPAATPKIQQGFRPLPRPTPFVQRSTDTSAPTTAASGSAPKTSTSSSANRRANAIRTTPATSPLSDAPASIQRSDSDASDMALRLPAPTVHADSPVMGTGDNAGTTPQATIQRSAQPTAAERADTQLAARAGVLPSSGIQASVAGNIQRAISQELALRDRPQLPDAPEATAAVPSPAWATGGALPTAAPVVQRASTRRIETRGETDGLTIQRQVDPRVTSRLESGAIARAVSKVQMPLVYRKATGASTDGERTSVMDAPSFDLPLVRAGVLPQTSIQRVIEPAAEVRETAPANSGGRIQRVSTRSDLPLRRSAAAASRSDAASARKNITIEGPVFQAQQATIQRKWKSGKQALTAMKKFGAKVRKRGKQFLSGPSSDKDAEQTTRSGGQNLDELAEQIMPIVKRMLAIERERRSGRTSNY